MFGSLMNLVGATDTYTTKFGCHGRSCVHLGLLFPGDGHS